MNELKDKKEIIEKVKKLFNLSKSSNLHEAELAALKAKELLDKYNLKMFEINHHQLDGNINENEIIRYQRMEKWETVLISSLTALFDITAVRAKQGKDFFITAIGYSEDIEFFVYFYDFIKKQAKSNYKKFGSTKDFYFGFITGIIGKLKEQKKDREKIALSKDLMLYKEANVKDYIQKTKGKLGMYKTKTSYSYSKDYESGYQKGNQLQIHQPVRENPFHCVESDKV
ncbi:MAG TPA: hypothetical protein DHW82_04155 [Spirochaetia bacterium]|nr:hypothetical protein [Spirochaetia bacterium]